MSTASEKSVNLNGLEDGDGEGTGPTGKSGKDAVKPKYPANRSLQAESNDGKSSSLGNGTQMAVKDLYPGDIIIKAQLGDTIKCVTYNNHEPTFVDLLKLLERMFKKAFKATDDDIILKYRDNDGDYVTIDDTDDVWFAIRTCHGLNVRITRSEPNLKPENSKIKVTDAVRSELLEIRDRVDKILDRLEVTESGGSGPSIVALKAAGPPRPTTPSAESVSIRSGPVTSQDHLTTTSGNQVMPPVAGLGGNEFDPLTGVTSTDDRRPSSASSVASQKSQPVSTAQVNKVIDSFQPTSSDAHSPSVPSVGVSSNSTSARVEIPQQQQASQQCSTVQTQSSQPTSSLFDYGHGSGAKPGAMTGQTNQAAQFQVGTAPAPGTPAQHALQQPQTQPNVPTPSSILYGAPPAVAQSVPPQQTTPSPYNQAPQYQYQAAPPSSYPGGTTQGYPSLPTSNAPTPTWNDPNSNQQANNYMNMAPQMNQQLPPQQSPMPTMPSQTPYARPQTPVYGQMGGGQAPPPMGPGQGAPSMGVAAPPMGGPPQMSGVPPPMGAPPMGSAFRPGAPPPSVGSTQQGAPSNPYSRAGAGRFGM